MPTTTTTPADEAATGRRAAKADESYESLRQRMLEGDTRVTPAQLDKARQAADHAALLEESARLKAERDQEWIRAARYAQALEDFEADRKSHLDGSSLAAGQKLYRDAVKAVRALNAGLLAYRADYDALVDQGTLLGFTVGQSPETAGLGGWDQLGVKRVLDAVTAEGSQHVPTSITQGPPSSAGVATHRFHDEKARQNSDDAFEGRYSSDRYPEYAP